MKLICVVISISLISIGCYTQGPISRDEAAFCEETMFFCLRDGSCIKSEVGDYQRKEGGYQVKGEFVRGTPQVSVDTLKMTDISTLYILNGSSIGGDGSAPDNAAVTFLLQDGSKETSSAGNHHWLGTGYEVKGERRKDMSGEAFDGMVWDDDLNQVNVEQFDTGSTIVAIAVPVAIVAVLASGVFGPLHLNLSSAFHQPIR